MNTVTFTEWNPLMVIQMAKQASRRNLEESSQLLIDRIKESMRSSKSGREYSVGWMKHKASKTGETPAIMFGELFEALEYKIYDDGNEIISRIGVNVDGTEDGYAIYLELGVPSINLGERSYLRRTMFQNEDEIRRILSG